MSETHRLFNSNVATSFCNLDSSFVPNASLEKRSEGWTEVWGVSNPQEQDGTNFGDWDNEKESAISQFLSTPHPQLSLTLVQYRPAWFEQALLRIAGIPHVVVNSPYASAESTGPLPFLRDLPKNDKKQPILVGRNHPVDTAPTALAHKGGKSVHNSIFDYLHSEKKIDLDSRLSDTQKALAYTYSCMIEKQLNPIIVALRFGDEDAWHNVHRPQCIRAATRGDNRWFPVGAWIQAWAERAVALKQLTLRADGKVSVAEARADARKGYEAFEAQLKQHPSSSYLLGTSVPSTVDALLWAHLAEALGDVYLVTVLADFPLLAEYFQHFYENHFECKADDNDDGWKAWNYAENLRNPFQQLPQEASNNFTDEHDFQSTLKLMQSLSVHKHDLKEVLVVARESRESEQVISSKRLPNTWHRWRMGGEIYPPTTEDPSQQQEPAQHQKWRKDNKNNDELWISTVIAGTVLALVFSTAVRK